MPAVSRQLSRRVQRRDFTEDELVRADGAGDAWAAKRQQGLRRLSLRLQAQYQQSAAWANSIRDGLSDLRFTDASRVPFPFVRVMHDTFNLCSVVTASRGRISRISTATGCSTSAARTA